MLEAPYYPIIYVRGYAGSQSEVEDTVATPYMGLNLGSTKVRQLYTGDVDRHIFESPLVRLMKDHGYHDTYSDGAEIERSDRVPARSVWIYRYYEPVSRELGSGKRPEIEDYATGLLQLIERVRDQVCGVDENDPVITAGRAAFRCYLVAHSMGGLVVRCYLQNIARDRALTRKITGRDDYTHPVDKVFTYATPHGGIDFRLIGNVPEFLRLNNVENFNDKRMRDYLALPEGKPVTSLGDAFDADRFFCLVGTNHRDYEAARGFSRRAVGPMSDGLVQIKNASVLGAPRAFVHRAHSGHYGIVNSEEGYQNLRRFLFGQVRVDGLLDIKNISLPSKVQAQLDNGKDVKASYHIEAVARMRGSRWDLHRRTVGEQAAVHVNWGRIKQGRPVFLLTAFLLDAARVASRRRSLGFSLDLRVMVPEYVIEKKWRPDDHYDGGYIFRDKINLEVTLGSGKPPSLKYGMDSRSPNRATRTDAVTRDLGNGRFEFRIPVKQKARPGIDAELVLRTGPWS